MADDKTTIIKSIRLTTEEQSMLAEKSELVNDKLISLNKPTLKQSALAHIVLESCLPHLTVDHNGQILVVITPAD